MGKTIDNIQSLGQEYIDVLNANLTEDDAKSIAAEIPGVTVVAPASGGGELVLGVFGREVGLGQRQPCAGDVGRGGDRLRGARPQVVRRLPGKIRLLAGGGLGGLPADHEDEAARGLGTFRSLRYRMARLGMNE